MRLHDLCIKQIKVNIQEARNQMNHLAHRVQMGENLSLETWEPISKSFDEVVEWLEAMVEFQVILDRVINPSHKCMGQDKDTAVVSPEYAKMSHRSMGADH